MRVPASHERAETLARLRRPELCSPVALAHLLTPTVRRGGFQVWRFTGLQKTGVQATMQYFRQVRNTTLGKCGNLPGVMAAPDGI